MRMRAATLTTLTGPGWVLDGGRAQRDHGGGAEGEGEGEAHTQLRVDVLEELGVQVCDLILEQCTVCDAHLEGRAVHVYHLHGSHAQTQHRTRVHRCTHAHTNVAKHKHRCWELPPPPPEVARSVKPPDNIQFRGIKQQLTVRGGLIVPIWYLAPLVVVDTRVGGPAAR
jgi:hypothetical protein